MGNYKSHFCYFLTFYKPNLWLLIETIINFSSKICDFLYLFYHKRNMVFIQNIAAAEPRYCDQFTVKTHLCSQY